MNKKEFINYLEGFIESLEANEDYEVAAFISVILKKAETLDELEKESHDIWAVPKDIYNWAIKQLDDKGNFEIVYNETDNRGGTGV